jgi:hypothetical protein
MANFKASKVVSSLPGTLEANTLYFVRTGAGFNIYLTDNTGLLVFQPNSSGGGGSQQVFVQQTRPSATGPWQWWVTNATGNIINLIVNDGA